MFRCVRRLRRVQRLASVLHWLNVVRRVSITGKGGRFAIKAAKRRSVNRTRVWETDERCLTVFSRLVHFSSVNREVLASAVTFERMVRCSS